MRQDTIKIKGKEITFETGEIARQANGSVLVRQGDTVVLVAVISEEEPREATDFFPLTVEYREKIAAAGRIPGGFIKRESRPQDHEILASRLIDRSIRPLFPEHFVCETQVFATVFSFDPDAMAEPLCILGAAAALTLSDIPWDGPLGGIRLVQKKGKIIPLPSMAEREGSELDLMISSSRKGPVMLEGIAEEASEKNLLDMIEFAAESLEPFWQMLEKWQEIGLAKRACGCIEHPAEIREEAAKTFPALLTKAFLEAQEKQERKRKIQDVVNAAKESLLEKFPEQEVAISAILEELQYKTFRQYMIREKKRIDGRGFKEIRPISGKVGFLPRVHGSALFTRGETQALVSCTLGTSQDEQIVETLEKEYRQRFMLHYNFPPYSVREIKALRGPGRREIGHGNLATRALQYTIPSEEKFPYTVRVVSDITESNGSSSMATVCGGCLALMDAGTPIKKPVAGVAMGLIQEGGEILILSDIMGDEDHLGDMDFKVAGTRDGITAVQMDNKLGSLPEGVMGKALAQARESRLHILDEMKKILPASRPNLSPRAPRVEMVTIRKDRIRDLIGPGGKVIQEIQEQYSVRIDVNSDNGEVKIYSQDEKGCKDALKRVNSLTKEPEVNKIYRGKVVSIKNFGAFVRIFGNTEGLVHISELDLKRVETVESILKEGEEIIVKVLGVDPSGKIRLSRKAALGAKESEIEG